jgi:hypothetical protein
MVLSNKKSVFKGFMSSARYFDLLLNNPVKNLEEQVFFMYISMKRLSEQPGSEGPGDIDSLLDGRFS